MSNVKTMCPLVIAIVALWQLLLFGTHVWLHIDVLMDQRVLLADPNLDILYVGQSNAAPFCEN